MPPRFTPILIAILFLNLAAHGVVAQTQRKPLTNAEAQERVRLLAELNENQTKTLQDSDAQIKQEQKKDADLSKRITTLAKAKRRTAKTEKTALELNERLEETRENLNSLQQTRASQADAFEQKQREIIAKYPLLDEVPLTRHGNRWLTRDEYAEVLEHEKTAKQQKTSRANGQRLADWVWLSLARNYDLKAAATNVVSIRQAGVRFVNPDPKQVYSLKPDKTEVELRPLNRNAELDESYAFQIEYVTRSGQVIRKEGYVEVGYDDSGTAYLLGVMVPFLENPLDGQLAATRSSLDRALQRAFGR